MEKELSKETVPAIEAKEELEKEERGGWGVSKIIQSN